jgi:hypothetical protein
MLVPPGPGSRHQLAAAPGSLFLRELQSEVLAKIDFVKKSRTPPMLYAMSEPMTRYNSPDRHVAENKK